jgi:peptide methionine sulfoxide reductase MsrB
MCCIDGKSFDRSFLIGVFDWGAADLKLRFCINSTFFKVCPPNVDEMCAPGTVCVQSTALAIACDWPQRIAV